jgi:hypothetical protein
MSSRILTKYLIYISVMNQALLDSYVIKEYIVYIRLSKICKSSKYANSPILIDIVVTKTMYKYVRA